MKTAALLLIAVTLASCSSTPSYKPYASIATDSASDTATTMKLQRSTAETLAAQQAADAAPTAATTQAVQLNGLRSRRGWGGVGGLLRGKRFSGRALQLHRSSCVARAVCRDGCIRFIRGGTTAAREGYGDEEKGGGLHVCGD